MDWKSKCLTCESVAAGITRTLAGREENWKLVLELVWDFNVFRENKDCSVCQSVAQYFLSDDPPCLLRHCQISLDAVGSPPRIWLYPVSMCSVPRTDLRLTRLR